MEKNLDKKAQYFLIMNDCSNLLIKRNKTGKDLYVSDLMVMFYREMTRPRGNGVMGEYWQALCERRNGLKETLIAGMKAEIKQLQKEKYSRVLEACNETSEKIKDLQGQLAQLEEG